MVNQCAIILMIYAFKKMKKNSVHLLDSIAKNEINLQWRCLNNKIVQKRNTAIFA